MTTTAIKRHAPAHSSFRAVRPKKNNAFQKLNEDLIVSIAEFLNFSDIQQLTRVAKICHQALLRGEGETGVVTICRNEIERKPLLTQVRLNKIEKFVSFSKQPEANAKRIQILAPYVKNVKCHTNITRTKLTKLITNWPHICQLSLSHCSRIQAADFECLRSLPLVRLNFEYCSFSNPGLAQLQNTLTDLDISNAQILTDEGLTHLSALPRLRRLVIAGSAITDAGVARLEAVPIEELNISGCDLISAATVARIKNLTSLHIARCRQVNRAWLSQLKFLPLKDICLLECPEVDDEALAPLIALPLVEVDLLNCHEISDAGATHLSKLSQLQRLHLGDCTKLTDLALSRLSPLQLQQLTLSGCHRITDVGISYLVKHPIQYLHLGDCEKVTDAALPHLRKLPLRELSIFGTQITKKGAQDHLAPSVLARKIGNFPIHSGL